MSKLEVDAIEPQSGTTLTIGASGDSVTLGSGASLTSPGLTLSDNILFNAASKGIYLGVTTATASNLLDDYEEGTWTPAVTGETGFAFGSGSTGTTVSYTKIGRMFYTAFKIRCNTITDGTQTFELTGWPFAPSSVGTNGLVTRPSSNRGTKVPSGYEDVVLVLGDLGTTANIRAINKGTTDVDWSAALDVNEVFSAGGWTLDFIVWYEVA